MKSTPDTAAQFREEVLYWQKELGLLHWTIQIKTATTKNADEAEADYDCETRHATITYYMDVDDSYHPADVALHEMLHLLFADMLLAAVEAKRGDEDDIHVGREEHKVVVTLMRLLSKKK